MRFLNNTQVDEKEMQTSIRTVSDGCAHELPSGAYAWTFVHKLDMHAWALSHIPHADVCAVSLSIGIFYGILGKHMGSHLLKNEYSLSDGKLPLM
jgi:hypothetical protein